MEHDANNRDASIFGAVHRAIRAHQAAYYDRPIEIRMTRATAKALAVECGLANPTDDEIDDAKVMGCVVAVDESLAYGETVAWPTPDAKAMTAAVARFRFNR